MFLVHVRLRPHPLGALLPESVAALMAAADPTATAGGSTTGPTDPITAGGIGRVEHVSLHPRAESGPVIGVYVHARDPAAAEWVAVDAWHRAVAREPALNAWKLMAEPPLMRPDHDV
ncbi:PAS domain-containing protein [Streptomyces narbonensis]|uniref:PAS domain-containing protein n=1 Tax=Streptomyces narbonensis TaxID=67333 RepID=A0ABV3CMG2_9ACTN